MRSSRHADQIRIALKRGQSTQRKTNTGVFFDPEYRELLTFDGVRKYVLPAGPRTLLSFDGPRVFHNGTLRFLHYDSEVLAVEFERSRITDRGYSYYSTTTQANVSGWFLALQRGNHLPVRLPHDWWMWTRNWRKTQERWRRGRKLNNSPEPDKYDELFELFRERVPWCSRDESYPRYGTWDYTWWFHWDKYVDNVAQALWTSLRFLHEDQNHRYFTYEWGEHPWGKNPTWPLPQHWVRRFIDADAERRWRKREKRNGRPCLPIY